MGLDGASVITALTVQNSHGLSAVEPVSANTVRRVLQAVLEDGEPAAVKVGLPGAADVVQELAEFLAARRCPVVLDPVLAASNGRHAYGDPTEALLPALHALMRHVDVITPNLPEAHALLRRPGAIDIAALRSLCRGAVVLKGGHAQGGESIDWVSDGRRCARLSGPRLPDPAHGTGCVFSAALAGAMAGGWDVFDAAVEAKLRVHAGLHRARFRPGRAHMQTAVGLDSAHLPALHWQAESAVQRPAPPLTAAPFAPLSGPLGFYPVVPDADMVERLLDWGVSTVQLRVKTGSMPAPRLEAEIERAVQAGRRCPGAQVFINDHWVQAMALGAYGVHLGQEDVEEADLRKLRDAGMRLGLSSHTPAEIARAHALQPSYLAIGPIYPTTLKAMRYEAVGLARLRDWTRWCQPRYPVVAIGGISLERAPGVLACGVDSVAVVSAVTQAAHPREAVSAFQRLCRETLLAGPSATQASPSTSSIVNKPRPGPADR